MPTPPVVAAVAKPVVKVEPPPVVKAEPKIETKPTAKPEQKDGDRDDALNAVRSWAKAWSDQDVKGYLAFYGNEFKAPNGATRSAWAEERRARIEGKNKISVKIEAPQVTIKGNTATVKFRQLYVSDRLSANSRKILVLTKQGGAWRIQQEQSGN